MTHVVADGQVHATMGLKGQRQLRGQPTVGIKHAARRHCTAPVDMPDAASAALAAAASSPASDSTCMVKGGDIGGFGGG